MPGIQASLADDLQSYHIPIGLLGFVNQLVNSYVLLMFTCSCRPLWPRHPLRHGHYSTALCVITMMLILGFDSNSISHLDRWELITSVVGNLTLFICFLGIALGGYHGTKGQKAAGPQPGTIEEPQLISFDGPNESRLSRDLERCDTIVEDDDNVSPDSKTKTKHMEDLDAFGVLEPPANRPSVKEADLLDSLSTSATLQDGGSESQTRKIAVDTDKGAALYMLIFNMPGTILIFAGLVGHLVRDLTADWQSKGQLLSIVILFSVLLGATTLGMLAHALRSITRRERDSGGEEEATPKKSTWKDPIFLGSIMLSFLVVSFDKWLLAALVGDIHGTKYIQSHGYVPLIYMLLTKLPALAL